MIVIENEDQETKKGNITRYEEIENTILIEPNCPVCEEQMTAKEEKVSMSQGPLTTIYHYICDKCYLSFHGSEYEFSSFEDFHKFVEDKLND